MSSKYNSLFFERYIRGECSDSERRSFESALAESEELRSSFEKTKAYFDLIQTIPQISVSEDFTDRVIHDITVRAEKRKFRFPQISKGIFSREVIGVLASVIVLVALFGPQLSSVVDSVLPSKKLELSMDMATEESAEYYEEKKEEKKYKEELTKESESPMTRSKMVSIHDESQVSDAFVGEVSEDTQMYASSPAIEAVMNEDQPKLLKEEFEVSELGVSESKLDFKDSKMAKKVAPTVQVESLKREAFLEPLNEMKVHENHGESFPYAVYDASVVKGDTLLVTLPTKNLRRFIKAWKKYGGSVIDTIVKDSTVTLRVKK